ncbi:hypothetical protein BC940DRAFT_242769 [Gongronella butleri]|nr:hypothetical protein BC940DRAFT_242769 [Gongronella butleri]
MDTSPSLGLTPPVLSYFCVYNPSLSQSEENTKDQILYYTANKVVPADVKMKQVGLAQALVSVAASFATSQPTQNVHSQKHRLVFLQPEPGFWIHMCVELAVHRRQISDAKGKEKLVTEYLDADLSDHALECLLQVGYEQFNLLNGTMAWMLYEDDAPGVAPSRQRTRSLMHAIEEFFSAWIWQWDFSRLDTLLFGAIFNSIPTQPLQRANYLRLQDLDRQWHQAHPYLAHILVLDDRGSLIYRSPSLGLGDVRTLRKYVLKRCDAHHLHLNKQRQRSLEKQALEKKQSTLKAITKSLSQAQLLSYFKPAASSASASAPTSSSASIDSRTANINANANDDTEDTHTPDDAASLESDGVFLTGMIQATMEDMNGDEHAVTKQELVRVFLNTPSDADAVTMDDTLTEYYLVIYRDARQLLWSFLLPLDQEHDVDAILADIELYAALSQLVAHANTRSLVDAVCDDMDTVQKKTYVPWI